MADQSQFDKYIIQASKELAKAKTAKEIELVRIKYVGRNGRCTAEFRNLPEADKKRLGRDYNRVGAKLQAMFAEAKINQTEAQKQGSFDPTMPGPQPVIGHLHPVTLVLRDIEWIFTSMGFDIVEGPEVENDWHNFEALNMGPDHPARDMQDTFYVAGSEDKQGRFTMLPRTHTSSVQIRAMKDRPPPLRIIAPGKVYRNEAEDATHNAVFHQVEGLMVDDHTTFTDLKGILTAVVRELLGQEAKLRFRPSFFPYTEPSAEIDVSSPRVRSGQWLELAGAGMVHPNVLRAVGYDPNKLQGFAFGIGPARLAMLKYGIDDLRPFFKPDVRLLEQF